jgi:hypothetical protein
VIAEPNRYQETGVYVDLFEEIIEHAQRTGRRGDWARLRRRLESIRSRLETERSTRSAMTVQHRRDSIAFDLWLRVLAEELLREFRERVLQELLEPGDVPPEIWTPLDPDRAAEVARARTRRAIAAESSIYAGAQRCRRAPSVPRVDEALSALEDLRALRAEPIRDAEALAAASRALVDVLAGIFPPAARTALVDELEARWPSAADVPQHGAGDRNTDLMLRDAGVQNGDLPWERLAPRVREMGTLGVWFTSKLQRQCRAIHERWLQEETDARDAAAERDRAAAAERQRLADEKAHQAQALLIKQLGEQIADLAAWDKGASRRRAAAMKRISEAPEIAFYELKKELLARKQLIKMIPRTEREWMVDERAKVVRARIETDFNRQEQTERTRRLEAIEVLRMNVAKGNADSGPTAGNPTAA